MKRFLAIALIGTVGLIYSAGSASADATGTVGAAMMGANMNKTTGYTDGLSANGVGMSRHNLGIFGMHTIAGWDDDGGEDSLLAPTQSTSEICVFCHTPHHTRSGAVGPLWNRGSNEATFTAYAGTIGDDYASSGGFSNNAYAPGAASLACMSCHDGVTQFDVLVNAPGMGGVTFDGADTASLGWTFREKQGSTFGDTHRLTIGADTNGNASVDLSNDHPVGMEYRGGEVASLRPASTIIANIDLIGGAFMEGDELPTGLDAASFDGSNLSQNLWAVYGFLKSDATIQMLLKGSGDRATVECGTCHDPHFNNKSWGESAGMGSSYNSGTLLIGTAQELIGLVQMEHSNGLFLRRVGGNAGSGVCRTCHDK
jgi:hypothetical protein